MVAAGEDDYQKSLGCGMCIEITANGEQTSPSTGGPTPMKGTYKAYIGDLCGACKQGGFTMVGISNEWHTSLSTTSTQHLKRKLSAYVHLITLKDTIISIRTPTHTSDCLCLKMNITLLEHSLRVAVPSLQEKRLHVGY